MKAKLKVVLLFIVFLAILSKSYAWKYPEFPYRKIIKIEETGGISKENEQKIITITGSDGAIQDCTRIRITNCTDVDCSVEDEYQWFAIDENTVNGNFYRCKIRLQFNISANDVKYFAIYYGNNSVTPATTQSLEAYEWTEEIDAESSYNAGPWTGANQFTNYENIVDEDWSTYGVPDNTGGYPSRIDVTYSGISYYYYVYRYDIIAKVRFGCKFAEWDRLKVNTEYVDPSHDCQMGYLEYEEETYTVTFGQLGSDTLTITYLYYWESSYQDPRFYEEKIKLYYRRDTSSTVVKIPPTIEILEGHLVNTSERKIAIFASDDDSSEVNITVKSNGNIIFEGNISSGSYAVIDLPDETTLNLTVEAKDTANGITTTKKVVSDLGDLVKYVSFGGVINDTDVLIEGETIEGSASGERNILVRSSPFIGRTSQAIFTVTTPSSTNVEVRINDQQETYTISGTSTITKDFDFTDGNAYLMVRCKGDCSISYNITPKFRYDNVADVGKFISLDKITSTNLLTNETYYEVTQYTITTNPPLDLPIKYVAISSGATSSTFDGTSCPITTVEGVTACNLTAIGKNFTIPATGTLPGPFAVWDNTLWSGSIASLSDIYLTLDGVNEVSFAQNEINYFGTRNVTITTNPPSDMIINYIEIASGATEAKFDGIDCPITTVEGVTVCNLTAIGKNFTIPATGTLPGPFKLYDGSWKKAMTITSYSQVCDQSMCKYEASLNIPDAVFSNYPLRIKPTADLMWFDRRIVGSEKAYIDGYSVGPGGGILTWSVEDNRLVVKVPTNFMSSSLAPGTHTLLIVYTLSTPKAPGGGGGIPQPKVEDLVWKPSKMELKMLPGEQREVKLQICNFGKGSMFPYIESDSPYANIPAPAVGELKPNECKEVKVIVKAPEKLPAEIIIRATFVNIERRLVIRIEPTAKGEIEKQKEVYNELMKLRSDIYDQVAKGKDVSQAILYYNKALEEYNKGNFDKAMQYIQLARQSMPKEEEKPIITPTGFIRKIRDVFSRIFGFIAYMVAYMQAFVMSVVSH